MAVFYDINHPKILELGTATGTISIPLAEAGYFVDTVDYAKDMQAIAQNKILSRKLDISKRINFILEDICNFSPSKKYDAVIIPDSLFTEQTITEFLMSNQELQHWAGGCPR